MTVFGRYQSEYLTVSGSYGSYVVNGSNVIKGYGTYAWKNNTGENVRVYYKLSTSKWLDDGMPYGAYLFTGTTATDRDSSNTWGVTYYEGTVTGYRDLPANHYFGLFSDHDAYNKLTLYIID